MQVLNTTTNTVINLAVIDPKNGVNYVEDLIGNTDGFRDFESVDEADYQYKADGETIAWWENVISLENKYNELFAQKVEEHGYDAVISEIEHIDIDDLDIRYEALIDALNDM